MKYSKRSRFGVISGHTVRRPEFSYGQLCAQQQIVIQTSTLNTGISGTGELVTLSMNKRNRWQLADGDFSETDLLSDCAMVISQHHLKPGRGGSSLADCTTTFINRGGETSVRCANKTYARVENLANLGSEECSDEDASDEPSDKCRREEEVLVHCKVYTAPSKRHFQVQPPRASYSSKSAKTRKGVPGGNLSYYWDAYEDEISMVDDAGDDWLYWETIEASLDDNQSHDWQHTSCEATTTLENLIHHSSEKKPKSSKMRKSASKLNVESSKKTAKDRVFYVDREEYAVPESAYEEKYVPMARNAKLLEDGRRKRRRGGRRKRQQAEPVDIKLPSSHADDQPWFLTTIYGDSVKNDSRQSVLDCFGEVSYLWGRCVPPRLAVDVTGYITGKLDAGGFSNSIRAIEETRKKFWMLMEGEDARNSDGYEITLRITLVGFPRNLDLDFETEKSLEHASDIRRVMRILKAHIDQLPLEEFFTTTASPSGKPELSVDLLSRTLQWNSSSDCWTQQSLLNQVDAVEHLTDDRRGVEYLLQPVWNAGICGICLGEDVTWLEGLKTYTTALTDCLHWFCNSCWRRYLQIKIDYGETKLTCPAHDCKIPVDDITLLSFLSASFFRRYKHQQMEFLRVSQRLEACPKEGCGYLLPRPKMGANLGLLCACGGVWCSGCKDKLHWPSTCEQNEEYKRRYRNGAGVIKRGKINQVNVKKCPACSYPVEKSGGCIHMTCRCTYSFCWSCGGDWDGHSYTCYAKKRVIYNMEVDLVDVIVILNSSFDRAVFHRTRYRRSAIKAREIQANNLVSRLLSTLQGLDNNNTHKKQVSTRSKVTWIDKDTAVERLSEELKGALRFCNEVEFVLEHLEIFLTSKTILRLDRRRLVLGIKDRLTYISNQIHQILEQTTYFDLLTVSSRLSMMTNAGRENLQRLVVTLR